jgi:RNA polymerase primary sigma factor
MEAARAALQEAIEDVLRRLDGPEAEVLRLRFGLYDGHPRTRKDVSLKFNITRQRVAKIETSAISKLRKMTARRSLRGLRLAMQIYRDVSERGG